MGLLDYILSIFYPDHCPYCNKVIKNNEFACEKCREDFPPYTLTRFAKGGYYCYSPFRYTGNYENAIKRMKFNNRPEYSHKLIYPMAETVRKNIYPVDFDFISYVPMHKRKLRERGYNQAELLAKDLGKLLKIPCEDAIIKIIDNKEQHKCKKDERSKNVRGVYEAAKPSAIKGSKILLVDDIITTGNTLGECCKILKRSGAKEIYCVTLCAVN